VLNLEVLQLWRRSRKVSQQGFEVRGVQDAQGAKKVVEGDGKEGLYVAPVTEA